MRAVHAHAHAHALAQAQANAHAPNESINLPYAKKLTCALASVIHATAVN